MNTSSGRRDMTDQKSIWVFIEHTDGEIADVSLELTGRARELADQLGYEVVGLLCGHDVDALAAGRHPPRRRPRPARGPSRAGRLPDAPVRPRRDRRSLEAQAGDLPDRRDAKRPRLRAACRQRLALRPDGRLHGPPDRRLLRQEGRQDLQGSALPDPAGFRRQPDRHDRQPEHAASDGHGPRRRHAQAAPPTPAARGSSRR